MDKIAKFLRKLNQTELEIVCRAIEQILSGDDKNLDIKKLKGFEDIYRVRIRDIRIIYRQTNNDVTLIEISRRDEKTYRKY